MDKRFIGVAVAFALVVGIWLGLSTKTAPSSPPFRIGYNGDSLNHAPIMLAQDAGFFADAGVNVQLVALASGKEIRQGVATGDLDVGLAGATHFFSVIGKGAPVKIIAPLTSSATQVFVRPDTYRSLRELIGKPVATGGLGSSGFSFRHALLQEGIDLEGFSVVDIEQSLRPIALMRQRSVDAAVEGDANGAIYEQEGAVILPEWIEKGYGQALFPRTVIAVRIETLETRGQDLSRLLQALTSAVQFLREQPERAAALLRDHVARTTNGAVQLSADEILESLRSVQFDAWMDPAVFADLADADLAVGSLEAPLALDDFFDQRFAEQLKIRQKELDGTSR